MKITLNWLREYVPFEGSPEDLVERLTQLGLEVERLEKLAGAFEGVVVAEVLTREKHPNADKLSVCRVNDGKGERQIVCGAQNFQAGDKVPLILPGHALPPGPDDKEPFVIKVGKIRGVESHGMMCAADELGLDPESLGLRREEGLLILRPDARVGQPFAEYLGRGGADVVYDLEVTPNRPDLNSVVGIAREIAAVTGNPLRLPEAALPADGGAGGRAAEWVAVRIDAPDLCPRYSARVIRGLTVRPSPDWLRARLEKVGLRSINNVVDVTNYVMLETGQPLHAFDYRRIQPGDTGIPTIVVRRAADGEKFLTLDGREHSLARDHLLIADPQGGIALAGVMGGRNTEVSEATTDVLLESAYFEPAGIRRTSKALGLRTDASYRFERGADPGATVAASARAARLLLDVAGGSLAEGVVDVCSTPAAPRSITLRHGRVNALLGTSLRPEEIDFHLGQLGLKTVRRRARAVDDPGPPEPTTYQVPTYRVDLKREIDLIEEVARLHGVDRIAATAPRHAQGFHAFDARYDELMEMRRLLTGLGLSEVQGQTLVSGSAVGCLSASAPVGLANPLSADMDVLRPTLMAGLLDIARHNVRHQNSDLALFEIGRVFRGGGSGTEEAWRLAILLSGARSPGFWKGTERGESFEAVDLKGLIEELFEHLGLRGAVFQRREGPHAWMIESASIALGGRVPLGEMGQLQPALARRYDLREAVLVADVDLEALLARRNRARAYKALPVHPAIRRDVAILVPERLSHEEVVQAIRQAKPANLDAVELFDVFRGKHVPEGRKSLAYALTYRAADRTLTDAEVNATHEKVVAHLKQALGAALRE